MSNVTIPELTPGTSPLTGTEQFESVQGGNSVSFTSAQIAATGKPFVNVLWPPYNADPTGTLDSTAAIQAAINSLASGGGIVFFPAGTYKTTAPLAVSTTGIQLLGASRLGSIIRTTQTAGNIITVTASYTEINELGLVGTSGQVATAGAAIGATGSQGSKFTNLYISDVYNGILLTGSTANLIQFIKLLDIYGLGIQSSNGGGDFIVNCQLDPLFYATTAYGWTSGYGAWATSTGYAAGAVVYVNNGWFVCQTGGISASLGSGPPITAFGTLITDGAVSWYFVGAYGGIGINLTATSNSNFIAFNDISGPWTNGIQIANSDGNIIKGNTFGQELGDGIQLLASATNTQIEGNLFSGMYGPDAIAISDSTGSSTGTRVINNEIIGTGWYGIFIQGSTGWIIANNTITGCGVITGAYAIEVAAGTTNFIINGNAINPSSGQTGPVQVATGASDYYQIIGNQVGTGVILDGGSGTHKVVFLTDAFSIGALTLSGALTYGGVTLANAVTGTGKMVLNASPTITVPTVNFGTGAISQIPFASTNTGFGNQLNLFNGGTPSDSGTYAAINIALNAGVSVNLVYEVVGGATPKGYISSGTGISGGLQLSAQSGSLELGALTSQPVGFYGNTGSTQQTVSGSRGSNVALASLLTALATLGLIVDGSS